MVNDTFDERFWDYFEINLQKRALCWKEIYKDFFTIVKLSTPEDPYLQNRYLYVLSNLDLSKSKDFPFSDDAHTMKFERDIVSYFSKHFYHQGDTGENAVELIASYVLKEFKWSLPQAKDLSPQVVDFLDSLKIILERDQIWQFDFGFARTALRRNVNTVDDVANFVAEETINFFCKRKFYFIKNF